jgi:hypothetical protein
LIFNLASFTNYHNITKDNILNYTIKPIFTPVYLDDNEDGREWMFVFLSESGNIYEKYSIAYDYKNKYFSVIEFSQQDNKFISIIGAENLKDALEGM